VKGLVAPGIEADALRSIASDALDASELDALARLDASHSAWPVDAIFLSPRAQNLMTNWTGKTILAWGFWDQNIRSVITTAGELLLDAAGSYRLAYRF
jgi:hypothetical protein